MVLGNHLISVRRTEEKDLAGIQENAILGSSCFKNQMARCKSQSILIIAALLSIVTILSNNVNAQTQSSPHNLSAASAKDLFSAIAATVGVAGGLAGLAKFFSDRQEKETREWQKVSIYRVLSENESKPIRFTQIRDSHRAEGGSVNVRRKDLEEKEIRRALLEMKASGIVKFYPDDSFKLDIIEPKLDLAVEFQRASIAIDKVIGEAPPFTYSLKEAASQIAEIVGENKKRMIATLLQSVKAGYFVLNDSGKIASIADAFDQPQ